MKCRCKDSLVICLAALLAAASFVMPADAAARDKGVFVITSNPSIGNLDPASSGTGANVMVYRNIFQALLRYKFNTNQLEGDLAKSWSMSKDGLVYTFKLRDNVKWHKGFGKVTAQDVKFTFDRIKDPKTNSQMLTDIQMVQEINAINDNTVEVRLKDRDVTFLNKCVVKPVAIVSQKAVEKYGPDFGRNPIGSGPYVLESMSREEVVLIANKEYYEGAPKIGKVIYKAIPDVDTQILGLLKGEIDCISGIFPEKTSFERIKAGGCIARGIAVGSNYILIMNPSVKPFTDPRVRKAIAYAINTNAIMDHLFAPGVAERLRSPVPKGSWGHTEKGLVQYNYNPKKAKELLTEAGYPNGFEVAFDTANISIYLPIATAIQDDLAKVGIKAKMEVSDETSWSKKVRGGTAQMSIYSPASIPDADGPLTTLYHSASFPPGRNLGRYDKLDKEIDDARGELNQAKRLKMYSEIEKKLMEDLPLIPLFQYGRGIAYRADVGGVPDRDPTYGPGFYRLFFKDK